MPLQSPDSEPRACPRGKRQQGEKYFRAGNIWSKIQRSFKQFISSISSKSNRRIARSEIPNMSAKQIPKWKDLPEVPGFPYVPHFSPNLETTESFRARLTINVGKASPGASSTKTARKTV